MSRISLFIMCAASLFSSCVTDASESVEEGEKVVVGQTLPTFSVQTNSGEVTSTSDLKGKPSVLVFFHTLCGDCQRELPLIEEAYSKYGERVSFLCISRKQSDEEVSNYWKENNLSLPYSAQDDTAVYNLFATSTIPRVYVSDSENCVRYIFIEEMGRDVLNSAIENVLNNK